jgi:protein ImuB
MTGKRILSIWWPRLAIECWWRTRGSDLPPDEAVVLVVDAAHGQMIHAATDTALDAGARVGARLTDARALSPGLVAMPADLAGDEALVERLAHWAGRWSPLVEIDGVDGLRIDVTGAAHLFGGEAGLTEDVVKRFSALGLAARVAIAPTAGAAWALSHFSPSPFEGEGGTRAEGVGGRGESLVRPLTPLALHASRPLLQGERDLAAQLAPLSVAALRLPPEPTQVLERLGLKTIGALAGVPRRSLARRFREADNPLDALDRVLGRRPEPLSASPAEPPPRSVFRLAEPVADPAVMGNALARMADPLCRELAQRRLGARRVAFLAYRVDGEVGEVEAETALPTRDPAHLVRLLGERVGALDPGFGFDEFALIGRWCEPLDAAQDALIGEPPRELQLAKLIDRLTVRLGANRVRRPAPYASHLPERASGWRPALDTPAEMQRLPAQRPERLLDQPEAIAVIYATPEGMPRRFIWRRGVHDISRVEGPERIAPEWWRQPGGTRLRDYYRVEDEAGRRFWIYREGIVGDGRGGAPAWFLHGLFG